MSFFIEIQISCKKINQTRLLINNYYKDHDWNFTSKFTYYVYKIFVFRVYTFSSKPTTPGEKTPDLLIRFQAVSRTQPCVQYRFMSVHSRTKLHQVRRYITKYFKNVYEGGFIFLCKTKEILKSDESKLTVFDILPKIPEVNGQTLQRCFQYPDVQYKKVRKREEIWTNFWNERLRLYKMLSDSYSSE